MNPYDMEDHRKADGNIKILVRIRESQKKTTEIASAFDTETSEQRVKSPTQKSTKFSTLGSANSAVRLRQERSKAVSRSKSPLMSPKSNTKNESTKQRGLNENNKYNIFTSTSPSNSLVITGKPITGKLINNTFLSTNDLYEYSYSLIQDATLLEFDKVFSETHRIEELYSQQYKECVSNLFSGKSSCCLFFGPTEGGKSFTLRGGNIGKSYENGILGRAVNDIFNLVEISRQHTAGGKRRQTQFNYFGIKMSVYQVYMDQINDLLSNQYSKSLKLEKVYDEEKDCYASIIHELTEKEIRNKKDYDNFLREAVQYRKCLAQSLKVNEMKKKSYLVVSLVIERREKTSEGYGKSRERTLERYAQLDFVEMAASNYGIAYGQRPDGYNDDILYRNTSKTFNAICNNIVSASVNNAPKYESKLTLALKNTLRFGSSIIFTDCVLPYAEGNRLKSSVKSLKFTNWLRNQIFNLQTNKDCKIRSAYEDSEGDNVEEPCERRRLRTINIPEKENEIPFKGYEEDYPEIPQRTVENQPTESNYQNTHKDLNYSSEDQEEDEIRKIRKRMKKKYPYMGSNSRIEFEEEPRISNKDIDKHLLQERAGRAPHERAESEGTVPTRHMREDSQHSTHHDRKLKDVEKSIRDLEAKSVEMTRYLDNLRNDRSRIYNPNDETNFNIKSMSSEYESEKIKQELATLKSDNIIFREDINRLTDVNRHLEDELTKQRSRNMELATENEHVIQEKNNMKTEIDRLNESVSKIKIQDQSMMDQFNQRMTYENKIRELENENKTLRDEKLKFEVDYKVLSERHNELSKQYDQLDSEHNYTKNRQTDEINKIEEKLDKMSKEMESQQRENSALRVNEDRLRQEVNNLEKQRDNYRDKYHDYKNKNNLLQGKLTEIEDEFKKLMFEKQAESFEKKKNEESKKVKIDSKQKIIEDMQSRISSYKSQLLKERSKKEKENYI